MVDAHGAISNWKSLCSGSVTLSVSDRHCSVESVMLSASDVFCAVGSVMLSASYLHCSLGSTMLLASNFHQKRLIWHYFCFYVVYGTLLLSLHRTLRIHCEYSTAQHSTEEPLFVLNRNGELKYNFLYTKKLIKYFHMKCKFLHDSCCDFIKKSQSW